MVIIGVGGPNSRPASHRVFASSAHGKDAELKWPRPQFMCRQLIIPPAVGMASARSGRFIGIYTVHDMINRLRLDPGTRTLGQLLQEREWAVNEIARLRGEHALQPPKGKATIGLREPASQLPLLGKVADPALSSHRLIRMSDICVLVGVSRAANSGPRDGFLLRRTATEKCALETGRYFGVADSVELVTVHHMYRDCGLNSGSKCLARNVSPTSGS